MTGRPARLASARSARQAAAAIAGPVLRAVLRGDDGRALAIVAEYDDGTLRALAAAVERLGELCREIGGRS
jgi:hypothetical protein